MVDACRINLLVKGLVRCGVASSDLSKRGEGSHRIYASNT